MKSINWAIIGCGNVTEAKSGPAFSRAADSNLVAVMRRDGAKAEDYARRHGVARWTTDAESLLTAPDIDAVYVATPPDSHAKYAIMAANAGKHIYVEKPMALNHAQCLEMIAAAEAAGVSLFTAYYRRSLPYFIKIKELLEGGAIGTPRMVTVKLFKPGPDQPFTAEELPWRYRPEIAGGGLFVDLGCHQLDILDYFFGPIVSVNGVARNQAGLYPAEDAVSASFLFESGVLGNGSWCFTAPKTTETDEIIITGGKGTITFSTFKFSPITLETVGDWDTFEFTRPEPIQQAMIQSITDELLGRGQCPGTGVSGARTTWAMEKILRG